MSQKNREAQQRGPHDDGRLSTDFGPKYEQRSAAAMKETAIP
ncbi:hypothetical protein Dfulv_12110 [Dactylosporangium fulvum]|uniref:Uncharacterized protein n=1 Tax=Dactylosporangium fulvum TaxID=53359 RepID=A0ABY5W4C8_9ACTN|nr:hypothetical protein [Dactylosporangium fulvum]UWP84923.1 hypothetical protein Dfulv_12110 [Dactylosporangium fulvum]